MEAWCFMLSSCLIIDAAGVVFRFVCFSFHVNLNVTLFWPKHTGKKRHKLKILSSYYLVDFHPRLNFKIYRSSLERMASNRANKKTNWIPTFICELCWLTDRNTHSCVCVCVEFYWTYIECLIHVHRKKKSYHQLYRYLKRKVISQLRLAVLASGREKSGTWSLILGIRNINTGYLVTSRAQW